METKETDVFGKSRHKRHLAVFFKNNRCRVWGEEDSSLINKWAKPVLVAHFTLLLHLYLQSVWRGYAVGEVPCWWRVYYLHQYSRYRNTKEI